MHRRLVREVITLEEATKPEAKPSSSEKRRPKELKRMEARVKAGIFFHMMSIIDIVSICILGLGRLKLNKLGDAESWLNHHRHSTDPADPLYRPLPPKSLLYHKTSFGSLLHLHSCFTAHHHTPC